MKGREGPVRVSAQWFCCCRPVEEGEERVLKLTQLTQLTHWLLPVRETRCSGNRCMAVGVRGARKCVHRWSRGVCGDLCVVRVRGDGNSGMERVGQKGMFAVARGTSSSASNLFMFVGGGGEGAPSCSCAREGVSGSLFGVLCVRVDNVCVSGEFGNLCVCNLCSRRVVRGDPCCKGGVRALSVRTVCGGVCIRVFLGHTEVFSCFSRLARCCRTRKN